MSNKALQPGDLVLITGVNGYIASHIADQLMSLGYHVRGTARASEKLDWIGETLRERNPSASFEGVVVSDVTKMDAFDSAVTNCVGVFHTATDVSFDSDPNNVVPQVVQGLRNILEAAAKTSTVKRFVYTSSSIAAVRPTPNERFHVDGSSWNEVDVRDAWAPPPYDPSRAFSVYGASKVEAERAGWEFIEKKHPKFVLNAVLPNFAIGPRLSKNQPGSTSGWVRGLFEGDPEKTETMRNFPPQWYVDVGDVARVHVAAMLEADVQNERLFAFSGTFNYSKIVSILERIDPSRQHYLPPIANEGEDLTTVDTARSTELLTRMGRSGFVGLEESLRAQMENEHIAG